MADGRVARQPGARRDGRDVLSMRGDTITSDAPMVTSTGNAKAARAS